MILQKSCEIHFNTREEVEEWLRMALEVVEAGDVPEDLRPAAFTAVYTVLAAKHVQLEQISMAGPRPAVLHG